MYRERFKQGNVLQQVMDTSSPVRKRSHTKAMCVRSATEVTCVIVLENDLVV